MATEQKKTSYDRNMISSIVWCKSVCVRAFFSRSIDLSYHPIRLNDFLLFHLFIKILNLYCFF